MWASWSNANVLDDALQSCSAKASRGADTVLSSLVISLRHVESGAVLSEHIVRAFWTTDMKWVAIDGKNAGSRDPLR